MFTGYPSYLEVALLVICLGLVIGLTAAFGNEASGGRDSVSFYTMWAGFAITTGGFCVMIYLVATMDTGVIESDDARQAINAFWITASMLGALGVNEFIRMRKRQRKTIDE